MLKNFKLVILDYPKLTLEEEQTQKLFLDTVYSKQMNFKRASEDYVSMNSLDMVSTHYLIYDTSNFLKPKQVLAIRTCYEHRARKHKLTLPVEDYIEYTPDVFKNKFLIFKSNVKSLVDCNAHYVDENYTFSKTGINLSEIAYFALITFILRKGYNNWVGATNEKFKASRWASKTGFYEDGLVFTHPKVEDPHKLIMIKDFNYKWLADCHQMYGNFIKSALEICPKSDSINESLDSYDTVSTLIQKRYSEVQITA